MAEKNMIKEYIGSSADKRVDIIMKNYTRFMGIVDGYIDGLRYMIEAEKDSNNRKDIGELGVRVQTGGMTSDPTAKHAIRNVMTRDALINCDFSGDVLDGVDHPEAYMKDAYMLKDMRRDYKLFNSQLCILGKDQEHFVKFISKETTLVAIAQEQGISYENAQQNMARNKRLVKKQVVGFMERKLGVSPYFCA